MTQTRSFRFAFGLSILGALFLVLAAGCGRKDTTDSGGAAGADLTPDRSITVTANDQMKFNVERIDATAGEVIELILKNVGTMPKFSMGHNLVILKLGSDSAAYVEAAMTAATHDYQPPALAGQVVAATRLLGGGESDTIVFKVPAKPGDYTFLCSFPGHFQVGMQGILVVR